MKTSSYMLCRSSKLFNMIRISYVNLFIMFIFKFAGQTLNKKRFWSKFCDTVPLMYRDFEILVRPKSSI